jgi:inner membrane transporter RhtA
VFWASYILLSQRTGRRFRGGDGLALAMVVAMVVPLIGALAGDDFDVVGPGVLAVGFGVAMMSSVIPYSLELEALRRLPAHVFGVLMSMEPAVATLAGLVVLGQTLGGRQLVAIALVVAASAGATRFAAGPPAPE